ncbi:MAG TPA: macro domain-containing protein [Candidatus Methylomirabilis sp.]|nr:macro domain-containing protein [Candidatus Methylomirabilis sp.]
MLEVVIQQGSLLAAEAAAIVNAANSQGWMGGGVAGAIRRAAGRAVEEEAVAAAPIPVGSAVVTSGGKTRFRGIVHAPTMEQPAMRIPAANVEAAMRAALEAAEAKGFASLAVPGLGTGVGGVAKPAAAAAMCRVLRTFPARRLKRVILVDLDPGMVAAWRDAWAAAAAGRP